MPAPFDSRDGVIGGAERYSFELARHMSERVETRLVTFGAETRRERVGQLDVVVLDGLHVRGQRSNPIAAALPGALRGAGSFTATSSMSSRAASPRRSRG